MGPSFERGRVSRHHPGCAITLGEPAGRVVTAHPAGRERAAMQQERYATARYRIVVRGRLGDSFTGLFDDLDYEARGGEGVLVGSFDQAGLHGLLDRLRDLGIQLVSVNPLGASGSGPTEAPASPGDL